MGKEYIFLILDNSSVVFWTIAYLLIIIYSIKFRSEYAQMIPMFAAMLSLGWEINAVIITRGFYGHILWMALDLIILLINIRILRKQRKKAWLYVALTILTLLVESIIFRLPNGMLISSFVIDCIIALEFAIAAKKITTRGRIYIAIARLIGDASAWIGYCEDSTIVAFIGAAVLALNVYYLSFCIKNRHAA